MFDPFRRIRLRRVPRPERRELLLGAGGMLLAGCLPRWSPKFSNEGWYNDIHSRCITPARDLSPRSLAEVVEIVQEGEKAKVRVRAVGAGHSFSDVAVVDGWVLRTFALDRPIPLRPGRLKPRCRSQSLYQVECGIRLRTLNGILERQGLALPDMGGWDLQTLVGVISTSTHGSGLDYGPFPSFVRSMTIVVSGGSVLQIEPTDGITDRAAFDGVVDTPCGPYPAQLVQDDDVFHAALVNMGCMGVIYSVVIEVMPSFWIHEEREVTTWEQVIRPEGFLGRLLRNGKPEAAWGGVSPDFYELLLNPYPVDGSHTCVITRRTKRYRNDDPSHDCRRRSTTLFEMVQSFGYDHPYAIPDLVDDEPEEIGTLLASGMKSVKDDCYESESYNVFNAGLVNELAAYSVDIGVALEQTIPAMQRIFETAVNRKLLRTGLHDAPISVRFVDGCSAFLSPQHGRKTCMIEIFALLGVPGTEGLLRDYETDLMEELGARPHWGLDLRALTGVDDLRRTYPRANDWLAVYAQLNQSGVFNGELTDRLQISSNPGQFRAWAKSHPCVPLR